MADRPTDPTLPETLKALLEDGPKPESIRLDEEGRWFHQGQPFTNKKIIQLFNRIITCTEGGTWMLQVDRYAYPIQVDDTGFFVEAADWSGTQPAVRLSDGSTETLDPETLTYRPVGRLYCRVKEGRYRARFKRNVYHRLADHMTEENGRVYLVVGEQKIFLAAIDDEPA